MAANAKPETLNEWFTKQNVNDDVRKVIEGYISGMPTACAALCKTELRREMMAQLVVTKDLAQEITGAALDMPTFMGEVAKILPDAFYDFTWEESYLSLDVMRQILYVIGPESRTIKKGKNPDVHWKIVIASNVTAENCEAIKKVKWSEIGGLPDPANDAKNDKITKAVLDSYTPMKNLNDGYSIVGSLLISTFKSGNAPTKSPALAEGNGRVMLLTMKQATILGLYILRKFTDLAEKNSMLILTPLSGAIFSRSNLEKMLAEPAIKNACKTMAQLIDSINKSAQNGGQFLNGSRTDIAAACVLAGTANVRKLEERESICKRTIKQYYSAGRPADKTVFQAVCKYATGGLPDGWTFETLLQESEAISRIRMEEALKQTQALLAPENQ